MSFLMKQWEGEAHMVDLANSIIETLSLLALKE